MSKVRIFMEYQMEFYFGISINQKSPAFTAKLFIGLTTKPPDFSGKQHNYLNFQYFNFVNSRQNLKNILFWAKKHFNFLKCFCFSGGLDGTRTRDPMRDRHVF
jgi:hypothetical protein